MPSARHPHADAGQRDVSDDDESVDGPVAVGAADGHVDPGVAQAGLAFQGAGPFVRQRRPMNADTVDAVHAWCDRLRDTTYTHTPCAPLPGAVAVFPHGSAEAQAWRARARWRGIPPSARAEPAVDPALPADVVVLREVAVPAYDTAAGVAQWSLEHLLQHTVCITTTCLMLDPDAVIIGLYVTSATDPAVSGVAAVGRQLAAQCPHTYPLKRRSHWYGKHVGNGYTGYNWVDGIQRFACPTKVANTFVTAFLPRRPDAHRAERLLAETFAGLQTLERRHVPDVYRRRVELARRAEFPGIIPGLPIERLAATYVGVTLDFTCRPHNDSSVAGTTETICWHRVPGDPVFGFAILQYGATLLLENSSCLYMPGDIWHGTPPNVSDACDFKHNSLGLVLMSKKALLADTDLTRQANRNVRDHVCN